MQYNWFKIFNLTDFEALGLVSIEYILDLDGVGEKTILATKGNGVSITYEGIMLMLNLGEKNPFEFEDHAVYVDESNDVFLGLPLEEEP
jgi:hypothetical protein